MSANAPGQGGRKRFNVGRVPLYAFVGIWAATEVYVLLWAVSSGFKSTVQIDLNPFSLPTSLSFSTFYQDLTGGGELHVPLGSFIEHSGIVVFSSLFCIMLISIPAGYAISKKSRLNTAVFYVLLAMIADPPCGDSNP